MDIEKAIAQLRIRQLAADVENEALTVVLEEALRYKKALHFYAEQNNYIDGVPMLKDPYTLQFTSDDEGAMARAALRRTDITSFKPLVMLEDDNAQA